MVQLNSVLATTLLMLPLLSTALPYNAEIPQENVVRDLEELYGREILLELRDLNHDLDARSFLKKLKHGFKTVEKIVKGPVGQAAAKSGLRILSKGGKLYRREADDLEELSARDIYDPELVLELRGLHNDLNARFHESAFDKIKHGFAVMQKAHPMGQLRIPMMAKAGKNYRREYDALDELSTRDIDELKELIARDYEELYEREWNELDERSFKSFLNGLKKIGGPILKIGAKFIKRDPEGTEALYVREFDDFDELSAREIDDLNELSARDVDDLKELIARNFEELYGREWNELDERSWKSFWNGLKKVGGTVLNIAGKVVKRDPEGSEELTVRELEDMLYGRDVEEREINDLD